MQTSIFELVDISAFFSKGILRRYRFFSFLFFSVLCLFIIYLLVLCVLQLNKEAMEKYLIGQQTLSAKELSKENASLEENILQENSMVNLTVLVENLNFEKTQKIIYLKVLEDQAMYSK